jgi:hypothetical protein
MITLQKVNVIWKFNGLNTDFWKAGCISFGAKNRNQYWW